MLNSLKMKPFVGSSVVFRFPCGVEHSFFRSWLDPVSVLCAQWRRLRLEPNGMRFVVLFVGDELDADFVSLDQEVLAVINEIYCFFSRCSDEFRVRCFGRFTRAQTYRCFGDFAGINFYFIFNF